MSEPEGPEAQRERAAHTDDDAALDQLAEKTTALFKAFLPEDIGVVVVFAKQRQHYVHTCIGTDMLPKAAAWVLEKATGDMKALVQ